MSLSLYDVTIPPFIRNLKTLSSLLTKALAHTASNETPLLESRLIADMQPLPYQIQRVSDTAKGVAVRVAKVTPEAWADDEKTFEELQARIAKTIAFLEKVDPKSMDGMDDEEVSFSGRTLKARDYVLHAAVPNFYFHFVTAYGLLRKEGVPIGKQDYLGTK